MLVVAVGLALPGPPSRALNGPLDVAQEPLVLLPLSIIALIGLLWALRTREFRKHVQAPGPIRIVAFEDATAPRDGAYGAAAAAPGVTSVADTTVVSNPGATPVTVVVAAPPTMAGTPQADGSQTVGLAIALRSRLTELSLRVPSSIPGAKSSGDFVELLATTKVDIKQPFAIAGNLLRLFRPSHAHDVSATIIERDEHPRCGVATEVTLLPKGPSAFRTYWEDSWEQAIDRAACGIGALVVPLSRAAERGPWCAWRYKPLPEELFFAYQLAQRRVRERRYDEALGEYHKALRLDPVNDHLRHVLGTVQESRGLYIDAWLTYRSIIRSYKERPTQDLDRANVAARRRIIVLTRYRSTVLLGFGERLARQVLPPPRGATSTRRREELDRLREQLRPVLRELFDEASREGYDGWEADVTLLGLDGLAAATHGSDPGEAAEAMPDGDSHEVAEATPDGDSDEVAEVTRDSDRNEVAEAAHDSDPDELDAFDLLLSNTVERGVRPTARERLKKGPRPTDEQIRDAQRRLRDDEDRERELRKAKLRLLFQMLAMHQVRRLLDEIRDDELVELGADLSRTALDLLPTWAQLRTEHARVLLRRALELPVDDNAWPPSSGDIRKLWDAHRSGRRSLLTAINESNVFIDHYNAACTYAIGLGHEHAEGLTRKQRSDLADSAVGELRRALNVADSEAIADRWDWIASKDPDLAGLRNEPEFRRLESERLPAAKPAPVRPTNIADLQASEHSVNLVTTFAQFLERLWHARADAPGAVDAHKVMRWWDEEQRMWQLLGTLVRHHRHWQTRLEAVNDARKLAASYGLPPMCVVQPRYVDAPLDVPDGQVENVSCRYVSFANSRLGALAEELEKPARGFDTWSKYFKLLDSRGDVLEHELVRRLAVQRADVWSEVPLFLDQRYTEELARRRLRATLRGLAATHKRVVVAQASQPSADPATNGAAAELQPSGSG